MLTREPYVFALPEISKSLVTAEFRGSKKMTNKKENKANKIKSLPKTQVVVI